MPDPSTRAISWPRIFAEGAVIVASILLALAADAWWDERQDRAEEREIIGRLISDVRADIQGVGQGLEILEEKQASLLRVDSLLSVSTTPGDPTAFLGDVVLGANYGWNQYVPRSVTFDELLGSGDFGLVRDPLLRERLSSYYRDQEGAGNRIDERETEYPDLTYQLVPRSPELRNLSEVASGLSRAEADRLVGEVFELLSRRHITAELNLARFIGQVFMLWREEAVELLDALEGYEGVID